MEFGLIFFFFSHFWSNQVKSSLFPSHLSSPALLRVVARHGSNGTRLLQFKKTVYLRVPSQVNIIIRVYVLIVGSESLII